MRAPVTDIITVLCPVCDAINAPCTQFDGTPTKFHESRIIHAMKGVTYA